VVLGQRGEGRTLYVLQNNEPLKAFARRNKPTIYKREIQADIRGYDPQIAEPSGSRNPFDYS